jgi:hypothetical protein
VLPSLGFCPTGRSSWAHIVGRLNPDLDPEARAKPPPPIYIAPTPRSNPESMSPVMWAQAKKRTTAVQERGKSSLKAVD